MADITGTNASEPLFGTEGADTINGLGGDDYIEGRGGDDLLNGGLGADEIYGGADNDTFRGDPLGDLWDGGDGNDRFEVSSSNAPLAATRLTGGAGFDTLVVKNNNYIVDFSLATIDADIENVVSEYDDFHTPIFTTQQFNQFQSASGGFRFANGGVVDFSGKTLSGTFLTSNAGITLFTGGGLVSVVGAGGVDTVTGGDGKQAFAGGAGNDTLDGGGGNDFLSGEQGNDTLYGGAGADRLSDDGGIVLIDAGADNDELTIASGAVVSAGAQLIGGSGTDILYAGSGGVSVNLSAASITGFEILGEGAYLLAAAQLPGFATVRAGTIRITNGGTIDLSGTVFTNDQLTLFLSDAGNELILPATIQVLTVHGGAGADVIRTGGGVDTLNGGAGNDQIEGGARRDIINGGADNDILKGQGGDDSLDGGTGADEMHGGVESDRYVVDNVGDVIVELAGEGDADQVTSSVSYTLSDYVEQLTLTGTAVSGTGSAQGNILSGNAVDNLLDGKEGDDQLYGFGGSDTLRGGSGNDQLNGGAANDTLEGGADADQLNGGAGADSMAGGTGGDSYTVDDAGDTVIEADGEGDDTVNTSVTYVLGANASVEHVILGGSGDYSLTGSSTDNQLTGNSGANTLRGLGGNDVLFGGAGPDAMIGGTGDDLYYRDDVGDTITELGGEGNDTLYTSLSFTQGSESLEHIVLTGSANASLSATVDNFANFLVGNTGNNLLEGFAGNDVLEGGDGNDSLKGGKGADAMIGGLGDDIYYVDEAGDTITELAGQGTDMLRTYLYQTTLAANLENLVGLLTTGQRLTGNDVANLIRGEAGNDVLAGEGGDDTLEGGLGADRLYGGLGNDTYFVDNAGDTVNEAYNAGTDRVIASISFALTEHVETLQLVAGNVAIDGTGNSQDNRLTGNDAANTLRGLGGADIIAGGAGNDSLFGGAGYDRLTGGTGADRFYFDTAPVTAQADFVDDFSVADDAVYLDRAIFTALGDGELDASAFRIGTAALDADDRILYDAATGNLWYDADGNGAQAAVQFARVGAGLALTNADFYGYHSGA